MISVLVPFADRGCEYRARAHDYVIHRYGELHPGWELVEGSSDAPWSKGRALADAVARASGDVFVLADADSFIDADTLSEAVSLVADGAPWVMPHRKVHRLNEKHTAEVLEGATPSLGRCHRSPYSGVVGGGITILSRTAWDTVGGVDPRFVGWGGEDLALGWALETLCGRCVRLDAPLLHLWHPPEVKGPHRRGLPESEALAGRYRQARGKPDLMRALVDEHASVAA